MVETHMKPCSRICCQAHTWGNKQQRLKTKMAWRDQDESDLAAGVPPEVINERNALIPAKSARQARIVGIGGRALKA